MRISVSTRNLLLLFVLTSPALLLAQFQQPTAEELKMTADPKAPGAAAVYLNIEEIANDPSHYRSFYARIKVLTEKGKEMATVEVPYLSGNTRITDIKARTIHPDGTVIPLIGKPEDLLVSKKKFEGGERFQIDKMVFTLPSVEVGSILEYRYELHRDDGRFSPPSWEIQRPYFVHKAHYLFIPFEGFGLLNQTGSQLIDEHGRAINSLVCWPKLPAGMSVNVDASGHYSLDIADVPPGPDEEWMPPIQSLLFKVIFYYKSANSVKDFWISEAKLWSKDVNDFADPSKSIHEAVDRLIAPGDSDLDKAKKLYKAVQALDNTHFSHHKSDAEMKQLKLKAAKHAEDTWAQKSGSREDITQLYLAMLRAAGLTAYAMKVVDREQGLFDTSYLTLNQLDDTLVVLSIGGKEIFLDPGEKMCPFQTVSWRHSDAGGIRQSEKGPVADTSPVQAYPENKTLRAADIALDNHGAMTANVRIVMTGQEALHWRQTALRNDEDEVKRQFDRWLESVVPDGVEAHVDSFTGLDDPYVNLVAAVEAHGNLGTATSKRLLLPGYFFETRGTHPFVEQDKRQEPVDMHYGDVASDQVTYHLPPGFSVEGAPREATIAWPDHALLIDKTAASPGKIVIVRQLAHAFTAVQPAGYQDLRGFYQKVAAADQQQLILSATALAKGN